MITADALAGIAKSAAARRVVVVPICFDLGARSTAEPEPKRRKRWGLGAVMAAGLKIAAR